MAAQRGLFDPDERYAALSKAGDPLERLAGVIDFELFRPELDATFDRSDGRQGGRPPMDPVLIVQGAGDPGALRSVGCRAVVAHDRAPPGNPLGTIRSTWRCRLPSMLETRPFIWLIVSFGRLLCRPENSLTYRSRCFGDIL